MCAVAVQIPLHAVGCMCEQGSRVTAAKVKAAQEEELSGEEDGADQIEGEQD